MKGKRKGIWLIAAGAAIVVAALLLRGVAGEPTPPVSHQNRMPVIVLDAGHGGVDGGATSADGVLEADINFDITMTLKGLFEDAGSQVILTRGRREGIFVNGENISVSKKQDMEMRKQIIRAANADLVLSIHQNAFPDARAHGAQVFFQKDTGAEAWADAVQDQLAQALQDGNKRRPQEGDFFIRVGEVPAVLVECGFLSHPTEGKRLQDPAYQKQLADAILQGTLSWWQAQNTAVQP